MSVWYTEGELNVITRYRVGFETRLHRKKRRRGSRFGLECGWSIAGPEEKETGNEQEPPSGPNRASALLGA